MLQPEAVLGRAEGEAAGRFVVDEHDRGALRGEAVAQPLPDALLVEAAEPFEVVAQDDRPQLGDRLHVLGPGRAQGPPDPAVLSNVHPVSMPTVRPGATRG